MESIPHFFQTYRAALFGAGFTITAIFVVWMGMLRFPPKESGFNLVDLEIAYSSRRVHEVLDRWSVNDSEWRSKLHRSIFLDFGFILGYSLTLAASFVYLVPEPEKQSGWLIAIAFLAGLFDVVENLGLLQLLTKAGTGAIPDGFPQATIAITAAASHVKWLLLALSGVVLAFLLAKWWRAVPLPVSLATMVLALGLGVFIVLYFSSVIDAIRSLEGR